MSEGRKREEGRREREEEEVKEERIQILLKSFIPQRRLASSQSYGCINENKWLLLLLE